MSKYSKSQEYRIRDRFRKQGLKAERVILSGACHKIGKGDVNVEDGKVIVDHKSTTGQKMITIHKADLEKIEEQSEDGLGVLTFSYYNSSTVYSVVPLDELILLLKERYGR